MNYTVKGSLSVSAPIIEFSERVLRQFGIDEDSFWAGAQAIFERFMPANEALLAERAELQKQITAFHKKNPGRPNFAEYHAFLQEIGYLVPEPKPFTVSTQNVDEEISSLAGPQLVVPVLNARFVLNAANARWGSLYDAFYGTDAVIAKTGDEAPGYDPLRGAKVIEEAKKFLNEAVPLLADGHENAVGYFVQNGLLSVELEDGSIKGLMHPERFVGYTGDPASPKTLMLKNNGLHIEIVFDAAGAIGKTDPTAIQDVLLESALTTIIDLEDSVAAVDAFDKAEGYQNWNGLIAGTLTSEVSKNGKTFTRTLNSDKEITTPSGGSATIAGRSLMLVRNVGHLMRSDAVLLNNAPVFEGILDAIMTTLGALPDLKPGTPAEALNSKTQSLYIVKPKMHGPKEVAYTTELFAAVEELFGLPSKTLKVGVMDEERRTSANLAACIYEARERVVFINTGFLDRTGDEIHTSSAAGPMLPKALIQQQDWLATYEDRNVNIGVAAGLTGRAQIGKGMWAKPDLMHDMYETKIGHVRQGASTAWVPSPTAATIHAIHYHYVNAFEERSARKSLAANNLETLLTPPLADPSQLDPATVQNELDNNVQSILGYVVRWIDQGIGCSKVPDINNVALMEDRATLRISSQLLANWLEHDIISADQVLEALRKYSGVVDEQNRSDKMYTLLTTDSLAFKAASDLIFEGSEQPSGYTEPILHAIRRQKKDSQFLSL